MRTFAGVSLPRAVIKFKQGFGKATNDPDLHDEGVVDETAGEIQEGFGKAKEKVGNAVKDIGDRIKR